jgi:peptide subunit release factor 1 (eRF1)
MQKPHGLAVYGLEATLKALEAGQLDHLLLSEDARYKQVEFECGHKQWLRTEEKAQMCPVCNAVKRAVYERDAADVLEGLVLEYSTKLTLVSADTREGQQFLALGGIGGFLRFRA